MQPMDSEVEFFPCTDDGCPLVSDHCPKSPFRYGLPGRRSVRDCGQINYGYYDGPRRRQSPQKAEKQSQGLPKDAQQHQQHHHSQEDQQDQQQPACQRPDKAPRRLQRSQSGPAGSLNKPSLLRHTCQKHISNGTDKAEVPPPVPPRTLKTGDLRRLSVVYIDEDKPPVVPPRDPLSRGSFRNPKSLPTYQNGVMPPTQSFAPDPKYVSCRGLQRQNSEGSPRIRPVVKNNEKVSDTHYYLSYCWSSLHWEAAACSTEPWDTAQRPGRQESARGFGLNIQVEKAKDWVETLERGGDKELLLIVIFFSPSCIVNRQGMSALYLVTGDVGRTLPPEIYV